eukprot:1899181-Pyramimonas_sp.AAC.1
MDAAGEAHEQAGHAELRGAWFEDILNTVLDQNIPTDKDGWTECVRAVVMAKNSLLRVHGRSPCQIALGRNPEVPTDLMQETPNVAANSAALHDEPFAEMEKRRQ